MPLHLSSLPVNISCRQSRSLLPISYFHTFPSWQNDSIDYYKTLEVEPDASQAAIKKSDLPSSQPSSPPHTQTNILHYTLSDNSTTSPNSTTPIIIHTILKPLRASFKYQKHTPPSVPLISASGTIANTVLATPVTPLPLLRTPTPPPQRPLALALPVVCLNAVHNSVALHQVSTAVVAGAHMVPNVKRKPMGLHLQLRMPQRDRKLLGLAPQTGLGQVVRQK